MQKVRVILTLITIGCILGPIGAVVLMYHNDLSQIVITPQIQNLFSNNNNNGNNNNNNNGNSNNNNSNNNNNGNNNDNNNNGNNNNNNGNSFANSGGTSNSNPQVNNPSSTYSGPGQFNVGQSNGNLGTEGMAASVTCWLQENGNDVQVSLDLIPQSVPNNMQSIFNTANDYVFDFAGTTNSSSSGTQVNANAQGSLNPGGSFDIYLTGVISQNSFSFTLTSGSDAQVSINTPQTITANSANNNNGNNSNNNSSNTPTPSGNNNSNNNNNSDNAPNINLDNSASQIDTATGKITLVFTASNTNSQSETVSKMSGTVIDNNDQTTLGTVSLQSSVTIPADQSMQVTVSGTLTSQGKADVSGKTSIDVELANGAMTVNGISYPESQPQDMGNVNVVS